MEVTDFVKLDFPENISNVFELSEKDIYYQEYEGDIVKWNRIENKEVWRQKSTHGLSTVYLTSKNVMYYSGWGGSPILAINRDGRKELEIHDYVFGYANCFIQDTDGIVVFGVSGLSKVNFKAKEVDWKIYCYSKSTKCNLTNGDGGQSILVGGIGDSLSFDYDNILSVEKADGKVNWSYRLKGEVTSGIAVDHEKAILGIKAPSSTDKKFNDANYIICLDKSSGNLLWKKRFSFAHGTKILVIGNNVFFAGWEKLFSVNAQTGEINWVKSFPVFAEILGVYKTNIVLKRADGLDLIDPNNGETERKITASLNGGPWMFEDNICYFSAGSLYISEF